MAQRMRRFVSTSRLPPEKRPAEARTRDWAEIYRSFVDAKAREQAARCAQCGVPFCQVHCPLGNNIPDWLKLIAEGRMEEAYEVAAATNAFPEICGKVCPHDRLCEGNCVIEKGFGGVTIGAIEAHIAETALASGWVRPPFPRAAKAADASPSSARGRPASPPPSACDATGMPSRSSTATTARAD
jgi:glutamate synthase (NADPH/NADH) small chain